MRLKLLLVGVMLLFVCGNAAAQVCYDPVADVYYHCDPYYAPGAYYAPGFAFFFGTGGYYNNYYNHGYHHGYYNHGYYGGGHGNWHGGGGGHRR